MLQPHIQLDENLGIKYAILPGDPARVDRIAKHLENEILAALEAFVKEEKNKIICLTNTL